MVMPPLPKKVPEKISTPVPTPGVWKNVSLKLTLDDGRKVKVQGRHLGTLCVHHPLARDGKVTQWAVSHMPTGLLLCVVDSEADALVIGQTLWKKVCLVMRNKTMEGVRANAPLWVKVWTKRCHRDRKYLDVTPYLKGTQ